MIISSYVDGSDNLNGKNKTFDKLNPHNGSLLYPVTISSNEGDVDKSIRSSQAAFDIWSIKTAVERGRYLVPLFKKCALMS